MIDAVVVGAGINGLAAAVVLARAGLDVEVWEANATPGGGARTLPLTEPGFIHDWGSAVHPMALASPFFREFGLADRIDVTAPEVSYAQPLDGRRAAVAWRELSRTVAGLGRDGRAWRRIFAPLVARSDSLLDTVMSPMLPVPTHPLVAAQFGLRIAQAGLPGAPWGLSGDEAPALLAGVFAHSIGRIPSLASAAPGLVLATLAHTVGWPIPSGGSQAITDALVADATAHGARILLDQRATSVAELPPARAVLLDTSPRALVAIMGDRVDPRYRRAATRYRHGDAATKVDFALRGPVPWAARDIAQAGAVHLGGTWREIAQAEADVAAGRHAERPYVLVSQPGIVDPTRAPEGTQTLWTYAHVPAGSSVDVRESVIAQLERFAPGFRDQIIATSITTAGDLERGDANLVGGDIATGRVSLRQLVARPVLSRVPWRAGHATYLCSAATLPGPGVHGMSGYHAARLALREVFSRPVPDLRP
ncbi:NAD(P)/FAD-dependent oxidoreductase [Microbacterium sp. CFH 90308]|uniref:NAD(P)/FAD-dependent oxidoreductase n=1 Tax=Microbacterium salsuginis TaxID=2722803 RepID=A0ABX1KD45_9MICO|nr:NAD(P)/FAD-dependent oxidoreductase [Microbacterium sp. CFH 90308]NLP84280.1 NAD(P)/FAD-dependent oxidoreductase [Microbacterium sp. CFH 90308]